MTFHFRVVPHANHETQHDKLMRATVLAGCVWLGAFAGFEEPSFDRIERWPRRWVANVSYDEMYGGSSAVQSEVGLNSMTRA